MIKIYGNVNSRKKINAIKSFQSANSIDKKLKALKGMEKLFPESELGLECMKLAFQIYAEGGSSEQVLSFGTRALRILISNDNANSPCFGTTSLGINENYGTLCFRYHNSSYYIALICNMLTVACLELKRYNESLSYSNWANRNLNILLEDNTSSCVGKCVLYALVHTQENLYWVKKVMGRFEEALPFWLKALEIQTKHFGNSSVAVAKMMNELAVIYTELGEDEKALEQIQLSQIMFKNTAPDSPEFLVGENGTATILIGLGRYEEAIDVLNRVVSHTNTEESLRGMVFVNLATALFYLGKCAKAKKHMKTAQIILEKKDMRPDWAATGFDEMSMLYEKMNDFGKATSLLRRALSIPNISHKLLAKGSTRLFSLISLAGKEEEGIPYMEDVVEKLKSKFGAEDCKVGHGYRNLGAAYLKSGREELAIKFLTKAKYILDEKLGPGHLDSLKTSQTLTETYANLRSYDLAMEIQKKVVEGLTELGPSEQETLDEAVGLMEKMEVAIGAADSENCDARSSKCGVAEDGK